MEWAVAGALVGWAGARLAGADRLRFAEAWTVPLLSFTPQVTAGAWISALLLRGEGPAAAAAAAGATLTAALGPRGVPHLQPPRGGSRAARLDGQSARWPGHGRGGCRAGRP